MFKKLLTTEKGRARRSTKRSNRKNKRVQKRVSKGRSTDSAASRAVKRASPSGSAAGGDTARAGRKRRRDKDRRDGKSGTKRSSREVEEKKTAKARGAKKSEKPRGKPREITADAVGILAAEAGSEKGGGGLRRFADNALDLLGDTGIQVSLGRDGVGVSFDDEDLDEGPGDGDRNDVDFGDDEGPPEEELAFYEDPDNYPLIGAAVAGLTAVLGAGVAVAVAVS